MGDSGVEVLKLESEKIVELVTIATVDDNEGSDAHYYINNFTRQAPKIFVDGHKVYVSPKICSNFRRQTNNFQRRQKTTVFVNSLTKASLLRSASKIGSHFKRRTS
jgi:glutaredoxin